MSSASVEPYTMTHEPSDDQFVNDPSVDDASMATGSMAMADEKPRGMEDEQLNEYIENHQNDIRTC